MIPHFTLRQGKQEYLIIRDKEAFHIIDINEALTKEKRSAVLESGCTPEQMQEMGLSGMTIPRSDISAVTVTGCGYQDDVIFYLGKKKKLCYWFPHACDQKRVDDFFRGIPRIQYKTRRRLKGGKGLDWRAREQEPQMLRKLGPVGKVYDGLCSVVFLGMVLTERRMFALWFWVMLAIIALGVYLNSAYPLYFSFFRYKSDYQQRGKGKTSFIGWGIAMMILVALIRTPYVILGWKALIVPTLILSILLWLGLYFACRECREDCLGWLLSFCLVAVFCGGMLIPHANHILGPEPQPQTASVVSKSTSTSGRGRRHWDITVRLPDGTQCTLPVSRQEYAETEHGDTWQVQVGEGFFGIEYVINE